MAIFHFNDLTPIFPLIDNFLNQFPTFSEKMKKVFLLEVCFFLQNAASNSVVLSSSFICVAVSNPSWRAKFCDNVGNIWNCLHNRLATTKYD